MNKGIKYFGIDISALVFDVTDSDGNYHQFKNNEFGFKKFAKLLNDKSLRYGSYGLLPLPASLPFAGVRYKSIGGESLVRKTFYTDGIIKNQDRQERLKAYLHVRTAGRVKALERQLQE